MNRPRIEEVLKWKFDYDDPKKIRKTIDRLLDNHSPSELVRHIVTDKKRINLLIYLIEELASRPFCEDGS